VLVAGRRRELLLDILFCRLELRTVLLFPPGNRQQSRRGLVTFDEHAVNKAPRGIRLAGLSHVDLMRTAVIGRNIFDGFGTHVTILRRRIEPCVSTNVELDNRLRGRPCP